MKQCNTIVLPVEQEVSTMGSNDAGQNADLMDYRDLPINLPNTPQYDVRQAIFGHTIRKLGLYATKGESIVWGFLHKEIDVPILQHGQLAQKIRKPKSKAQEAFNRHRELNKSITERGEVLATARTVFPLTLFHDDIVVDRSKVTFTKRSFFFMSEVMSISKEDILNVKVTLGPFFGSITIAVRILNSEDHHTISYLWRKDAVHIKHLIQGYIVAKHSGMDLKELKGLNKEEMVEILCKLGHDTS